MATFSLLNRRILASALIAVATALAALTVASPSLATAPPEWSVGRWREFGNDVPGPIPYSGFSDVSCASSGNCTAVGDFTAGGNRRPFTMTSTNGVWGPATPVSLAPNMLSTPLNATLYEVSCSSAGNCTAVGQFINLNGDRESLIATSTDGVWGTATNPTFVAGVHAASFDDQLRTVSCVSPGNCTAGGTFRPASGGSSAAFLVTSTNGVWGDGVSVSFPVGTVHAGGNAYIESVSCQSAGNCVAVGQYRQTVGYTAFAVSSIDGVWGTATPFVVNDPDFDAYSFPEGLSCPASGRCVAVGGYATSGPDGVFVVSSTNGTWGAATPVAFDAGVGGADGAEIFAVSCSTTTSCAAIGAAGTASGGYETFVVEMVDGVWQTAELVAFPAGVRNSSTNDEPKDIDCASAGYCTAVGDFYNAIGDTSAFTVELVDGTWGVAQSMTMPAGTQGANPYQYLISVSCPTAGNCTAAGTASDLTTPDQAYTLSSTFIPPAPPTTTAAPQPVFVAPTIAPTTTSTPSRTEPPATTVPAPALSVVRELPVAATPIVANPTLAVGGEVAVTFGGFTPFEFVQLIVASTPQVIGSGYADAQGVVTISGNLPTGLASGSHTLAVYAPESGVGFSQPIRVTAPRLPVTGSDDPTSLYVMALTLLVGGLLIRRVRVIARP